MDKIAKLFKKEIFTIEEVRNIESLVGIKMDNNDPDNIKNKLLEYIQTKINIPSTVLLHKETPSMKEIRYMSNKTAKSLTKDKTILTKYLTLNETPKTNLMYEQLNDSQKNCFNKLHTFFSSSLNLDTHEIDSPQIILMDAAGGTGKSFLVECLAQSLTWNIKLIVKSRKLVSNFTDIKTLNVSTTCKFIMEVFKCTFYIAIKLFDDISPIEEMIKHIYTIIKTAKDLSKLNLLIIDEYSLESPIFLLVLCILSLKYKFNILLIGDQKQQNAIKKTIYFNHSNFELMKSLNVVKFLNLNVQMRIIDVEYLETINIIRDKINESDKFGGEVALKFDSKYLLFQYFRDYFIKREDKLVNIYVSDTHLKLKSRLQEIKDYAETKKLKIQKEPYTALCLITQNKVNLMLPEDYKFPSYILLIEGMNYIYKKDNEMDEIIQLKTIYEDYLLVKSNTKNTEYIIRKSIWTLHSHACVDEQYEWMKTFTDNEIINYKIRPLLFTFHAIQGLTFNTETITFDLDVKTLNSIYVVLSRIKTKHQLSLIKTKEVLSLLYTEYKKDDYYYKVKTTNKAFTLNICKYYNDKNYQFETKDLDAAIKTLDDVKIFESGKFTNSRIKKSLYINKKREILEDSILLFIYNFFCLYKQETLSTQIDNSNLLVLFTKYTNNIQKEITLVNQKKLKVN